MNKEVQDICNLIAQKKIREAEDRIVYCSLESRIYFAKNAMFVDLLKSDPSYKVKIELIENGCFLQHFCNDEDWRVKLSVLKIHGKAFNENFDFGYEHPKVMEQMLKNGLEFEDYFDSNNDVIVEYVINHKGYNYAYDNDLIEDIDDASIEIKKILIKKGKSIKTKLIAESKELSLFSIPLLKKDVINNIFEMTNDNDIIKSCIEHSGDIQKYKNHDKIQTFVNNFENRSWAIEKGIYLDIILRKEQYYNCKETIKSLIKNNFLNYTINLDKGIKVYDLINLHLNIEIAILIAEYKPDFLLKYSGFYNDHIINGLYSNVYNIEVVDFLMTQTNNIELNQKLNNRKKYLLDLDTKNIIDNYQTKNKLLKQL
jgi:hypothetical protein